MNNLFGKPEEQDELLHTIPLPEISTPVEPAEVSLLPKPAPTSAPLAELTRDVESKKNTLTMIDGIAQMFGGSGKSTQGTRADLDKSLHDARNKNKYQLDSDMADPTSKASQTYRTLAKAQLLQKVDPKERAAFAEYIDSLPASELKQFIASNHSKAASKMIPGVGKNGERIWLWADPNTQQITETDYGAPFALGTVKDEEGIVNIVDKVTGGTKPISNKGQDLESTPEKEFSGTELYQNLTPQDRTDFSKVKELYKSDPVIKTLRAQAAEFDQVQAMIDHAKAGGQIDTKALASKMARAGGEVGNLAAHDKEGWAGDPRIFMQAYAWAKTKTTGEMTDADIRYAEQLLASMKKGALGKLQQNESRLVEEAAKVTGYKPEDARKLLTFESDFSEQQPQQKIHVPGDGGKKKVAKKLYSKSRDQTKIIYEDGTEEVVDGRQ